MRPGDTWVVTQYFSGAVTGTPTGVLNHNGVADAAAVTVTQIGSTTGYTFSVTIPSSGSYVEDVVIEMAATGTVSGVTQTAIIARDLIHLAQAYPTNFGALSIASNGKVAATTAAGDGVDAAAILLALNLAQNIGTITTVNSTTSVIVSGLPLISIVPLADYVGLWFAVVDVGATKFKARVQIAVPPTAGAGTTIVFTVPAIANMLANDPVYLF